MIRTSRNALWLALILAALLRIPSLPVSLWNIDEAKMAAEADILLSGGVYYRDAVGHRGPVTPYLYTGVFSIFGRYNMPALRFLLLLVVVGSTLLVWMVGRRAAGLAAGNCAALLFAVLSSVAFPASDLFAFNTEWPLALFVLLGSLLVVSMGNNKWVAFVAGVFYGLAFLSKQTAALECIGVAIFAVLLAINKLLTRDRKGLQNLVTTFLMVGGGFGLIVGGVVIAFWSAGAWEDFLFGFWTYNTSYYVGEISLLNRFGVLTDILWLAAGTAGLGIFAALGGLVALFRTKWLFKRGDLGDATQLFCLIWGVAAVAGMTLSGRFFGHYFIQGLAPMCVLTGIGYGALDAAVRKHRKDRWGNGLRPLRALAVLAVLISLSFHLTSLLPGRLDQQRRWVVDTPTEGLAMFLEERTDVEDRIFVWGFYPHPYVLAKRSPASRYTICTFITGSNAGEQVLARPVPGAMDQLVADLRQNRPRFIIDTSPWGYFGWGPFPLEEFPQLREFVEAEYVQDATIRQADGTVHFNVFRRRQEILNSEFTQ
jgi:4-amino-4-deoxy-L-arabinose transferase-like glycosyltransferase